MINLHRGSLQRTMIIYFLMISFASIVIAAEFIYDTHSKELCSAPGRNFASVSGVALRSAAAVQSIETLRDKAILMVFLLLVVVLILLTMFIKNITEPLQHMIETSKLVAAGDLSQTVDIHAKNELAELGITVNDLTSNLQEMILLSKGMCRSVNGFTAEILDVLHSKELDREKLEGLREKANRLRSEADFIDTVVENCKFYGIGR